MKKDCGIWISILSHKLKNRMNEKMQKSGFDRCAEPRTPLYS